MLEILLIAGVAYLVLCLAFVKILQWPNIRTDSKHLKNVRNVLFVIAHPDDECMFFSPSIIKLCQDAQQVYLLCLSTGNHGQQGSKRKLELMNSTKILGIDSNNVMIINHTNLPDDNLVIWNKTLVGRIIVKFIDVWNINTLITFDRSGVSGHYNHCAINEAVRSLTLKGRFPSNCQSYTLNDVNLLRKYIGILDVPFTYLSSSYAYVASSEEIRKGREAMSAHVSQMVWFRKLYISFSRYMVVNDFKRMSIDTMDSDSEDD
ncbi:hypothetical protein CHUAL_012921 [Chamberlinius hualienensis]